MSSMRHEAIYNTHPNVVTVDDGLGAFDKDGNSVLIDEVKVSQEIEKLNAKFKSTQYQRDRIYPSIEQQLDEIFHKGLDEWKKTIQAVKDKHPKPSE
tara:strand:+ start:263 stop:553 length:291 start_codon:yes stop_codon:yes gene_type:complete